MVIVLEWSSLGVKLACFSSRRFGTFLLFYMNTMDTFRDLLLQLPVFPHDKLVLLSLPSVPGWSWFESVDLTLDSRFFRDASAFVLLSISSIIQVPIGKQRRKTWTRERRTS